MGLKGKVIAGLGEGRHFLSLQQYKRGFLDVLGVEPYEGTLNIVLREEDAPKLLEIKKDAKIKISGFAHEGKEYCGIKACKAKIRGSEGALVFPGINMHPAEVAEFVCAENMREKYKLSDGDEVEVEVLG
ncbi:hypothetical protein COU37_03960 [Candidatus Micrarchaeota archaeon CG10_big_fil_rev_8_21_14_0_10_45_29]|nr:MAG: hypothetical protein COU37_03960 [Candidatus Micrarchaeota archaeon CG10_big_fil_rev_8_21_14_0_10_45_29]